MADVIVEKVEMVLLVDWDWEVEEIVVKVSSMLEVEVLCCFEVVADCCTGAPTARVV